MKRHTIFMISLLVILGCNRSLKDAIKYMDKDRPGLKPTLFAKDFITKKDRSEFGSVFNQQGSEFFYADDTDGKARILSTCIVNNKWSEPITIIEDETYSFNDPFLSPDENRLFYISDMPRNKQDTIKDFDIWYSERKGNNWSRPINAGSNINSDANEFYISFTDSGTMYFASNRNKKSKRQHDFDIYISQVSNDIFSTPQKLGDAINTGRYEADAFISPDESYIIFCSARKEGFGKGDLYISFKDEDNNWTKSENMGPIINSENHEICPFVTFDDKYLFYTSNQDIYWISTEFIDELRRSIL